MRMRKVATATGRAVPGNPEERMQIALFKWAAVVERMPHRRAVRLLFAVPNGGKRDPRTAARLKAAGVKAGVLDVCLPVARGGYHALWLELKCEKNDVTEKQAEWIAALKEEGCLVMVVRDDWAAAARVIEDYLDGKYVRAVESASGPGRTGLSAASVAPVTFPGIRVPEVKSGRLTEKQRAAIAAEIIERREP
jgi:hypothetical protein